MAVDSQWASTSLLLPLSSSVLDVKGHVTTQVGGIALSSAVGNPFGAGNALYCDGSNDVLTSTSADFTLGTGDCSIQFWFYPVTGGHGAAYSRLLAIGGFGVNGSLYIASSGMSDPMKFYFEYYNSGYSQLINEVATTISTNAWHFFQLDRVAGVWSCYIDGTLYSTQSTSINLTQTTLAIGANTDGTLPFKGYFFDVRVTKGGYRSSHAVPSEPFPRPTIKGVVRDSAGVPVQKSVLVYGRGSQVLEVGGNSDVSGNYVVRTKDFSEKVVSQYDELFDPLTDECVFDLVPALGKSGDTFTVDRKGHGVTFGGSAVNHTDGFSISLPASGSYVKATSNDFILGYGDFSVEVWIYPITGGHTGGGTYGRIFNIGTDTTAGYVNVNSWSNYDPMQISADFYDTAWRNLGTVYQNTATLANNTWHKIQFRRVNGVFYIYANGTLFLQSAVTNYNLTQNVLAFGSNPAGGTSFYGRVGPARVSRGPDRAAIIVPAANFLTGPSDGGSGSNILVYDRVIPG